MADSVWRVALPSHCSVSDFHGHDTQPRRRRKTTQLIDLGFFLWLVACVGCTVRCGIARAHLTLQWAERDAGVRLTPWADPHQRRLRRLQRPPP